MTNNIRVFLWLGLALALWLNYSQWQIDYGPKPTSVAGRSCRPDWRHQRAKASRLLDDTVPQAAQTAPAARRFQLAGSAAGRCSLRATRSLRRSKPPAIVRVTTDVLVLDIDLDRRHAGARRAARVIRSSRAKPAPVVPVQPRLGRPLTTCCRPAWSSVEADRRRPDAHRACSPPPPQKYHARARPGRTARAAHVDRRQWRHGHQDLRRSSRGMFAIGLEYSDRQRSSTASVGRRVRTRASSRTDPPGRALDVQGRELRVTRGPAMWPCKRTADRNRYRKLKIDKPDDTALSVEVKDGWLGRHAAPLS